MDIYDILVEAKSGNVEEATKQFIKFLSENFVESANLNLCSIGTELAKTGEIYTDEDLKRIAVVEFLSDFINSHKAEIESNYNLLPLTNDPSIQADISKIKNDEIENVNNQAVDRSKSKIEPKIKEQSDSFVDEEFDKYLKKLNGDVQAGEARVRENPNDAEAKEDLDSDKAFLTVLKAFDQNKAGLKEGVANTAIADIKSIIDGDILPDDPAIRNTANIKISIDDVQTQLENNPIWAKVTSKVPSDEIYELMGEVLAKKNKQFN